MQDIEEAASGATRKALKLTRCEFGVPVRGATDVVACGDVAVAEYVWGDGPQTQSLCVCAKHDVEMWLKENNP